MGMFKSSDTEYKNVSGGLPMVQPIQAIPVPTKAASAPVQAQAMPVEASPPMYAPPEKVVVASAHAQSVPNGSAHNQSVPSAPANSTKRSSIVSRASGPSFGRHPVQMSQCPLCSVANSRTTIRTYPGIVSWILAIGIFVLWFPLGYMPFICMPLAFVPLMMDKLKQTDHYCSSCQQKVGGISPFSDCCVKTM